MNWWMFAIPALPIFIIVGTNLFMERRRRLFDETIKMITVSFETLMERRSNLFKMHKTSQYPVPQYNYDRVIGPIYGLIERIVWRKVFGREWKHLLTGKQRFLAGIDKPDAEVPPLNYAIYVRKPWKVWKKTGFPEGVKIIAFNWDRSAVYVSMGKYDGVHSTFWTSPFTYVDRRRR